MAPGRAAPGRPRSLEELPPNIYAEVTFHAAYEPQRAIRTRRYKYIRRFENGQDGPVPANIDDSPSKDLLLSHGLAGHTTIAVRR